MSMNDTIRILIADDHPLFREGMRGRLNRVADVTVVGEAASGEEAVELAHELKPHVVLMDSGGEGVVYAIRAVTSGEAVFGPGVAERIIGYFSAPRSAAPQRAFPELTEREGEILSLVAQGKSNQEIARQLFVSLKTVRNHVSNILVKLQVADRAQAVIRARDAGIGHGRV